jgi:trigger factor
MPPGISEGKDFSYAITVEVAPHFEIEGYRGMELKRESTEVTEKDIDEALERLRMSRSQYKEVSRPAQDPDMVVVDFEAAIDGKVIKGSNTSDYSVVIGHRTPLPGFDEALKGASAGEKREVTLAIPKNYSESGLAGRDALFTITVKSVKEKITPALDDEFAKDLECDSLVVLRERTRGDLAKVKKDNEKTVIMDKLIERYQFDVPEALVNRYLGMTLGRVLDNMRHGFFTQEDMGLTPEALKDKYRPTALRQVREDMILDAIAEKEGVTATNEEYEEAVRNLAQSRGISYDELISRIEKERAVDVIKDGIKHGKVFDIILGAGVEPAS